MITNNNRALGKPSFFGKEIIPLVRLVRLVRPSIKMFSMG